MINVLLWAGILILAVVIYRKVEEILERLDHIETEIEEIDTSSSDSGGKKLERIKNVLEAEIDE